jgi:hypothetical protein
VLRDTSISAVPNPGACAVSARTLSRHAASFLHSRTQAAAARISAILSSANRSLRAGTVSSGAERKQGVTSHFPHSGRKTAFVETSRLLHSAHSDARVTFIRRPTWEERHSPAKWACTVRVYRSSRSKALFLRSSEVAFRLLPFSCNVPSEGNGIRAWLGWTGGGLSYAQWTNSCFSILVWSNSIP